MKYGRILLLVLAVAAAAGLATLGALAPNAEATLPPGAGCGSPTPTPGAGKIDCVVSATLPAGAGQNANGVCINCTGTGGFNNSAALKTNAAGCGATVPTVGAQGSKVWADWSATSCVQPGNTVVIEFKTASSLSKVDSVKWNLADASVIDGTATLECPSSVGGLAELPGGAGSSSGLNYIALGGLAAAALAALTAGAWYARRPWVR